MAKEKIKLIIKTIQGLIDVIDPPVNDTNYADRLLKKNEAGEVDYVMIAQLEKIEPCEGES